MFNTWEDLNHNQDLTDDDTDGDGTPNYLDVDDDDDGVLTADENPDPNGDLNNADAADSDFDGQPDYLDAPLAASTGRVGNEAKISATSGGLTATLEDTDRFGSDVSAIGDIDGDGVVDLAVGAYRDDDGVTDAGAVYVLFMNADGTVRAEQKISAAEGGLASPLDSSDHFGLAVDGLGDIDGDGVGDIVVGAYLDDDGGSGAGAAYVLMLNPDGTVKAEQKIANGSGGLAVVLEANDNFGVSVAGLGDLDGDGFLDLAVGAYNDDDGGLNTGAIYILSLDASGSVVAEQKLSATQGGVVGPLDSVDSFGRSIAPLGDLDGDGVIDIGVGAHLDGDGAVQAGAVYIFFLNSDGTVKAEQKISSVHGGLTAPLDAADLFGVGLEAVGDLNGDGQPT